LGTGRAEGKGAPSAAVVVGFSRSSIRAHTHPDDEHLAVVDLGLEDLARLDRSRVGRDEVLLGLAALGAAALDEELRAKEEGEG
jgi:hypothetical protein